MTYKLPRKTVMGILQSEIKVDLLITCYVFISLITVVIIKSELAIACGFMPLIGMIQIRSCNDFLDALFCRVEAVKCQEFELTEAMIKNSKFAIRGYKIDFVDEKGKSKSIKLYHPSIQDRLQLWIKTEDKVTVFYYLKFSKKMLGYKNNNEKRNEWGRSKNIYKYQLMFDEEELISNE